MRTIRGLFFVVRQYERAVMETFGKYSKYLHPGLHIQIPLVQLTRTRDIREHTMDIAPQQVITSDNVEIEVDGIMWVMPGNDEEYIKRTFYNIDRWKDAVLELAQTNLRQEFGHLTLDESLVAREQISKNMQISLDDLTENWGLKVTKVEIKLIDPPEDIKKAMHKQKTAEQERRAMKLIATGRFEAAEQDKLAAIQIADGKKEAEIKIAEGKAKAIELVNDAANKYFVGNAKELKQLEITETSLKDNSKIILSQDGITPTLLIGDLPVKTEKKSL
ncbi:SPFH domain-containing protein [Spirochaeta cellobiosiphila]|uniref:SPFH domain-containing protein n=1 Tax=Spirochaeta cellobiosiphila TaxID=504483 RepID=UPI00041C7FB7|nr:SPFH domain-containing protein [Spirochaeta cellobiosiphila]